MKIRNEDKNQGSDIDVDRMRYGRSNMIGRVGGTQFKKSGKKN